MRLFRNPFKAWFLNKSYPGATTKNHLNKSFDFVRAEKNDVAGIVKLCCNSFIQCEPHSKALNLTAEESKPLFEYIAGKSVHYPFSYKVIEKDTNRLIGFRLMSVGYRDETKDYSPFSLEDVQLSENIIKLVEILDEPKPKFWEVADEHVKKVLRREITFIVPEHQRKGIAKHLLHLGIDFEKLKNSGFDGVVSEATSIANQNLLSANGYKCLVEPDIKLEMHDGTEGVRVFFKDLKKESAAAKMRKIM